MWVESLRMTIMEVVNMKVMIKKMCHMTKKVCLKINKFIHNLDENNKLGPGGSIQGL
jgi:hypothetical protein